MEREGAVLAVMVRVTVEAAPLVRVVMMEEELVVGRKGIKRYIVQFNEGDQMLLYYIAFLLGLVGNCTGGH